MAKYRVEFSDDALDDLMKIREYLIDNSFDLDILRAIIDKISELEIAPQNNQIYHEKIYKLQIMRKNVVYYEIVDDVVLVSRVRAGRMNNLPKT
ncbi:MAG: type II toxin-antitoxin system RelE/ParE family toxin [Candidatus Nomurabacteria bacterium]|jgi:plasmid stabilization system protein ParE|nr:type II toxin-antitoxin system RelE/ParE family toxin [Candidatus Nomurabacteria bacterium]